MKKILFLIIMLTAAIIPSAAYADALGTRTGGWSTYMGADTYFHNEQFMSDSVGQQNEYYVEYTPNSDAVPVVVNGRTIWGTRNIEEAQSYMQSQGLRPLAGINADYFSFKTGIPMGYTIIDGEIASKEFGGQDAVGFRADGTGFIRWLDIKTSISDGSSKVEVQYINKWCQPGFDPIYLLTDRFGDSTKTNSECIFVICSPVEGRLHVNETMTVVVDDIFIYDGAIDIPDGKLVFVMDTSGDRTCYDFLSRRFVGERLIIANEAVGDDGTWASAENAVSSVGGRLIANGQVQSDFEAGAAPRTAVGIKPNGNIIFYTIDGRQKGYSYGAQLSTLAYRMAELGCTDAINLDGGGSTTISAWFPTHDAPMVVNSPSDGYLRNVANFLFLKDNRGHTNIPWIVTLKDAGNTNYLSGMSTKLEVETAYDTGNNKMDAVYNMKYRAETDTQSYIDENGYIIFNGTGDVYVIAGSDAGDLATQLYTTYETPEEIKIYNQADWKEISEISTYPSDEMQLALSAASYINGIELHSNNRLYKWEVVGNIGTVTEDGIFTLSNASDAEGEIRITAGNLTKRIPVHISDGVSTFADTSSHWARAIIDIMADTGIVRGMQEDGVTVFKPDNNMTRAEFASMISGYEHTDINEYANETLDFTDADEIPLWAQNAVKAMSAENIMLGRINDDGSYRFSPYDNITRAEAMTILGRVITDDTPLAELSFADKYEIPLWSQEGIQKLTALGIVSGYEDNTIHPDQNMTRAEAAAMLYKTETRRGN